MATVCNSNDVVLLVPAHILLYWVSILLEFVAHACSMWLYWADLHCTAKGKWHLKTLKTLRHMTCACVYVSKQNSFLVHFQMTRKCSKISSRVIIVWCGELLSEMWTLIKFAGTRPYRMFFSFRFSDNFSDIAVLQVITTAHVTWSLWFPMGFKIHTKQLNGGNTRAPHYENEPDKQVFVHLNYYTIRAEYRFRVKFGDPPRNDNFHKKITPCIHKKLAI